MDGTKSPAHNNILRNEWNETVVRNRKLYKTDDNNDDDDDDGGGNDVDIDSCSLTPWYSPFYLSGTLQLHCRSESMFLFYEFRSSAYIYVYWHFRFFEVFHMYPLYISSYAIRI